MEYKLGQEFVHPQTGSTGGCAKVVAIREQNESDWNILEEFKDSITLEDFLEETESNVVLFGEMDWEETYITIEDILNKEGEHDELNWGILVSQKEFLKNKEKNDKVVQILRELDLDTDDLIISDGILYQGYSQCSEYIQRTHAWCSSSMSC